MSYLGPFPLILADGGTNASLTASNGGIFYSTASAGAILSGTATASKMLLSGSSTTPTWSTSTIPTSAGATANKVLLSDGTNYVLSTPTFPNASATSGKIIISDGTNWIASTPTYPAAAGTSGNILKSDGTNWTSAAAGTSSISITGDSGGALTGSSFTFTGGTTGLTFAGATSTETLGGTLVVSNGGTGAATLTGLVKGNGTSAMSAITYTQAGSFTPGITIGGSSTGITYAAQFGEYSQIGNVVFVYWAVDLSSTGGLTGNVNLTGLPVASGANGAVMSAFSNGNLTYTGSDLTVVLGGSATGGNIQQTGTAGPASLTNANLANNTNIQGSGFYFSS